MKASLRWAMMLLGWGAFLTPSVTFAQSTSDQQAKTQPSDAVGPTELQNFSLSGSATKPADQKQQQSAPAPATATQSTPDAGTSTAPVAAPPVRLRTESRRLTESATKRSLSPAPTSVPTPTTTTETPPQPVATAPSPVTAQITQPSSLPSPLQPAPASGVLPQPAVSYLPWLVAAFALGLGTLFLFWRRRWREAYAGDGGYDMFVEPEALPAPIPAAPRPMPRTQEPQPVTPAATPVPPAPMPRSGGIVSSRLRPSLEIAVQPLRCLVEGDRVILEFELELFNAGTAPARAVQAEAGLLNAGGTHEQELAAFFSRPVGTGEQIDAIGPMKRMAFTSHVIAPRTSLPDYEVGGRKAIVPVLAFNTLYQWSGGKAQTSAAFLVGRETRSEKLAPFVSEGASREYRGLAAHLLPTSLRT